MAQVITAKRNHMRFNVYIDPQEKPPGIRHYRNILRQNGVNGVKSVSASHIAQGS